MGLTGHLITAGADEEVEVGAGVGLQHVVDVEPLPAAVGAAKPASVAASGVRRCELLVGDVERRGAGRRRRGR